MGEAGERPPGVFLRDGDTVIPTEAARGPWSPDALHGAAVAALLTGAVEGADEVLVRVLVELLGPVPVRPLTLAPAAVEGGRRVRRAVATLLDDGRPVARASGLRMRRTELTLPPAPNPEANPFTGDVPRASPTSRVKQLIPWHGFHDLGIATQHGLSEDPSRPVLVWVRSQLPTVAGEVDSGAQRAAAAADYCSVSTAAQLPYERWRFMNADLTVSLARPPVGEWVGVACANLVDPAGVGVSTGTLYDADGRLGQAAQSLLVEPRERVAPVL